MPAALNARHLRHLAIAAALLLALAGAGWLLRPWLFPPALPEGILEGHGRIEGTEVTVSSQVAGRIAALPVSEGDRIEQGALIAAVSSEEIEARVAQAEARVRAAQSAMDQASAKLATLAHHAVNARIDYRRDRELYDKGFISARALDRSGNALQLAEDEWRGAQASVAQARDEVAAARAARDEAGAAISETRIAAPLSATVTTKAAEAGELVFPGTPLVVLVDLTRPYLRVYLPERDIGKVKLGDTARVFVDSFPGRPFEAVVSEVAKKAEFTPKDVHMPDERVTLVYSVKLEIRNPQGLLKPGMPADALIRWKPGAPWGAVR